MNKKQHLELSDDEISSLTSLISKGQLPAKVFRRVTALLELARGKSLVETARTLSVTNQSVAAWRDHYLAEKLACVYDKPRSGRPVVISGEERAKLTALACSDAPEGYARWSLRLLAERAVELELVASVSHNEVGKILKKTNYSRISRRLGASEK